MTDHDITADDDLLLLAGGDVAPADEEDVQPAEPSPSPSPSPAASPVKATTENPPSPPLAKTAPKRKATATTKSTARKRRKTDSEEDGEASSAHSSPKEYLESAAMSESESDTSPSDLGNVRVSEFPIEGKFRDEKDKAHILAMNEVQREEILAERALRAEEEHQKATLRRMLEEREREEASRKKRKTSDINDSPRKSTRAKANKTNETLEEYKRQREQRGRERRRGEDRKARDRPSSNKDSDADAEGDSEVDWDDGRSKPATIEEPPADLIDYNRLRIGRTNFPIINFTPGFEEKIVGSYTRVHVGSSPDDTVYRMCHINGVVEDEPYAIAGTNGKLFTTDQYIVVANGKQEKHFPMIACSNSPFTPREFERYKIEMANSNMKLPTKAVLVSRLGNLNQLINHRWSDADIESKLRRAGIYQAKNATFERDRLDRERKAALSREDEAAVARIDGELAALKGPKLAFGTSLNGSGSSPAKKSGDTTTAPAAKAAQPSRLAAIEAVRKAQLAEKRAKEKATAEAARKRKLREQDEARKAALNPLFDEKSNSASRAGTPGDGEKKERLKERERTSLPTFKKKKMDDEIIGSMDLGIDIDI